MQFAKEMMEIRDALLKLGHEAIIPITTHQCVKQGGLNEDLNFCLENDVMIDHFNKVRDSEAILVLNYPKNDIKGYIGGSVLMEIAVAKYLGRKIFILHDLPSEKDLRYALEIKVAAPVILNGDLTKIK